MTALLTGSLLLAACDAGQPDPAPTPSPSASSASATPSVTRLSFGVYGPAEEVAAFEGVVHTYNSLSDDSRVTLDAWSDHDQLMESLKAGGKVPDVFLASRRDLAWLRENRLTQPVDDLLDERGVDFGDGYSRDALQAFSADNRLQCMPYGISPMVIYYNKELVDFDRMLARGLEVPDVGNGDTRWSFEEFTTAANFATRPRKKTRGLYVDPTLTGLAPFVYSGGGTLFDDEEEPTSLAFSEGGTRTALERTLELLRDPHLTLTERQLARAAPLRWFERGRLGMIQGHRSLVPRLRQVQGLEFDVMPMPVLDNAATVGDITGLCVSSDPAGISAAADFLVDVLSNEAVSRVTRAGYLAPANLEVGLSEEFLQPGRQPEHAAVFNSSVRSMVVPPLLDSWTELEQAVAPGLQELVYDPGLLDLEGLTERIDEASRTVLDPDGAGEPTGDATEDAE